MVVVPSLYNYQYILLYFYRWVQHKYLCFIHYNSIILYLVTNFLHILVLKIFIFSLFLFLFRFTCQWRDKSLDGPYCKHNCIEMLYTREHKIICLIERQFPMNSLQQTSDLPLSVCCSQTTGAVRRAILSLYTNRVFL